jgi:sulfur carrier protein ThiS
MAEKAEVEKWMQVIVEKLNDVGPIVAPDWGGSAQFVFPDLGTGWLLKMNMDGTVESCEEKIDEEAADGVVEFHSDTFVAIYNKEVVPMEAYSDGRLKVRKSIDALIKILPATVD